MGPWAPGSADVPGGFTSAITPAGVAGRARACALPRQGVPRSPRARSRRRVATAEQASEWSRPASAVAGPGRQDAGLSRRRAPPVRRPGLGRDQTPRPRRPAPPLAPAGSGSGSFPAPITPGVEPHARATSAAAAAAWPTPRGRRARARARRRGPFAALSGAGGRRGGRRQPPGDAPSPRAPRRCAPLREVPLE